MIIRQSSSVASSNSSRDQHQVLQAGLWNEVIWNTATRECFRKNPLTWYNTLYIIVIIISPTLDIQD